MSEDEFSRSVGRTPGGEFGWGEALNLTSVSEEELGARLKELAGEERAISHRRRVLRGGIDPMRAEFVRCGVTRSPEGLARVLLGEGRGASSPEVGG